MTQTQTDYDKALIEAYNNAVDPSRRVNSKSDIPMHYREIFSEGYEYGKKLSTADHERNLIALRDDYMTARQKAIARGNFNLNVHCITDGYIQGWNDSDAFDSEWLEQHPKDLLDRLLADHPDIIENEVKARMKDLESEQDHFRDSTLSAMPLSSLSRKNMMRYEIAKEIFTRSLTCEDAESRGWASRNIELHAKECVNYADALIKELGKTKE